MHKRQISQHGTFTLVELLVTLVIVGVLLGIAMPAFEKIVKGSKVDSAARSLSSSISLAKSQAVTNRKMTAVVFITDSPAPSYIPSQFMFGSFRICYVKFNDPNYDFDNWYPGSHWKAVDGALLAEADSADGWNNSGYTGLKAINNVNIKDITTDSTKLLHTAQGVIFTAYGNTINDTLRLILAEGIYDGSAKIYTGAEAGEPKNRREMSINCFTGRVKFEN